MLSCENVRQAQPDRYEPSRQSCLEPYTNVYYSGGGGGERESTKGREEGGSDDNLRVLKTPNGLQQFSALSL